jgi:hypothetical protein
MTLLRRRDKRRKDHPVAVILDVFRRVLKEE